MLKTVSSITNAIGALNYKGTWNASTNTPTLADGTGTKGDYYVVSVAGTTTLGGISTWNVGDWAVYNGAVWQRVEGGEDDPAPSLRSNSSTGLMEMTGPAAGQTRVVTIPDANATMARTDAGQTFTGDQIFSNDVLVGTTTKRAGVTSAKTNFLGQAALGARNTTNGGAYLTTGVWDEAATTHTIAFGSYSINDNASGLLVVSASNKSTLKAGTLILAFGKAFGTANVNVSTIATLNGGITSLSAAASGGDIVITTDADCSITYAVLGGF